jgi:hypothetical protein
VTDVAYHPKVFSKLCTVFMNNRLSKYINVHRYLLSYRKFMKNDTCIRKRYTIDHFLKYYHIHEQTSPSIPVK